MRSQTPSDTEGKELTVLAFQPKTPYVECLEIVEGVRDSYPEVSRLFPKFDKQLRALVAQYRAAHGIAQEADLMHRRLWYGIHVDGTLLAAVGLEPNWSEREGNWLFVTDFVCKRSRHGVLAFGKLLTFTEFIPLMVRGFIWKDNPTARRIGERRGWINQGVLLQKERHHGRTIR